MGKSGEGLRTLVWRKASRRGAEFRLLGECLRDELATPLPR